VGPLQSSNLPGGVKNFCQINGTETIRVQNILFLLGFLNKTRGFGGSMESEAVVRSKSARMEKQPESTLRTQIIKNSQ